MPSNQTSEYEQGRREIIHNSRLRDFYVCMELLPIVHESSGELTGDVLPRREAISKKAWCMSTNIFVLNSKGELLCHQRSMQKERYPGVWSTHLGGHVGHDETFETNAHKEIQEETGIYVEPSALIPWRTTKLERSRLWIGEFVLHLDQSTESLTPQVGEVDCFMWLSPEEIMRRSSENPEGWIIGTHDFAVEYHCCRAVLNAAHCVGRITLPEQLLKWHPLYARTAK